MEKALGEDDNNFSRYYQFVNQFGWKGSENEQLIAPHRIDIDKDGNIMWLILEIIEFQNMTQLKILFLNGEFKDTGGKGVDRIPHQLSVDNHGFVYLTDENSHQILKFDGNGKFIKILESKGSKAGQFFRPHDIVFDSNNNMYVIDMRNSRVQVIDRTLIN